MTSAIQKAHIKSVHPFPARMAPSIIWDVLPKTDKSLNILDPMSGSGTTLVCARLLGHHSIGCDTDPLALTISRSWCADIESKSLHHRGELVLKRAKNLISSHSLSGPEPYPKYADEETRRFIDFWFDERNRSELNALATCISRVRSPIERNVLWCAFSRMIITKTSGVSLAMDVSHSRPHRVYEIAPLQPFDLFPKSILRVSNNLPFSDSVNSFPPADIRQGDARKMPVEEASVDMIITSPPYLNAIDYLRGHKLALVWMGHNISTIRKLRSENIGSEVAQKSLSNLSVMEVMGAMTDLGSLDKRYLGMIRRYVCDMDKVMAECARVIKTKGRMVFVIGDSTSRGVFIKNSEALVRLADINGLSLTSRTMRPIEAKRRYLPSPNYKQAGGKMQSRMREEVILEFTTK